jgi:hypothetical protein
VVVKSGPVAQKVYLPEDAQDVVIFATSDHLATSDWFFRLNQALCVASITQGWYPLQTTFPLSSTYDIIRA